MVGKSYSEDQLMHTFLDNFQQGGKYSAQIAIHQAELIREEKFTDKKSLNISSLQTDYLNLDSSSGFDRNSGRTPDVQTECTFCGGVNHFAEKCLKRIRKKKEKACAVDFLSNRQMEHTPQKWFRYGSEDHMITKCPRQLFFNEKGNRACDNSENNSDCDIYASMAWMSSNDEWKTHGKTENWDRTLLQEGW